MLIINTPSLLIAYLMRLSTWLIYKSWRIYLRNVIRFAENKNSESVSKEMLLLIIDIILLYSINKQLFFTKKSIVNLYWTNE